MKQNIFRSNKSRIKNNLARIKHNLEFKSYPWWNRSVSCNSGYRCLVICIGFYGYATYIFADYYYGVAPACTI